LEGKREQRLTPWPHPAAQRITRRGTDIPGTERRTYLPFCVEQAVSKIQISDVSACCEPPRAIGMAGRGVLLAPSPAAGLTDSLFGKDEWWPNYRRFEVDALLTVLLLRQLRQALV
jgi:hypothetical protein